MIEDYIKSNLKGATFNEYEKTINDAINSNKEETLPGLGVLFKIYYNSLSNETKKTIINELMNLI